MSWSPPRFDGAYLMEPIQLEAAVSAGGVPDSPGATDAAGKPLQGIVERVVQSRFGPLAILAEYGPTEAWAVADEVRAIQDLRPGEEIAFGGGAAALFILRREQPGWHPGGTRDGDLKCASYPLSNT